MDPEQAYDARYETAKLPDSGGIPRELDRQQGAGLALQEVTSILEERLKPVRLAKPEPSGGIERDHPQPVRSDLEQAIANGTSQLTAAAHRLRTLINELEV